jgi:signal peptidase I
MDERPGLIATVKGATFNTVEFFSRPTRQRSRINPFVFVMLVSACTGPFIVLFSPGLRATLPQAVGSILALVIFAPITLVLETLWVHLAMRLFGRIGSLRDTLECVAYSQGPMLLAVLPLLGFLFALVWHVVVVVRALKTVHSVGTARALFAFALPILAPLPLAIGLRMFVVEAFKVPAGSMIPTIQVGDHLFVSKSAYASAAPQRGDVIVFIYPREPDKDFIKRVVAVGGDKLRVEDGKLYLNDQPLEHTPVPGECSYRDFDDERGQWETRHCGAFVEHNGGAAYQIIYDEPEKGEPAGNLAHTFTVPDGQLFVLGDNRQNSHDSRFWGTVPIKLVKGKAKVVWSTKDGPTWRPIH